MTTKSPDHAPIVTSPPSAWVTRHADLITEPGQILDLAAGSGRHTRYFKELGHSVLAVDRDVSGLADLPAEAKVEIRQIDLETGAPWPFADRRFAAIVVTNYLHRPLLPALGRALLAGGILIYETFAVGNERFGRPRNPDFLLREDELLDLARTCGLVVLAYEHGEVAIPHPAIIQRIVARKPNA
jgi:SAM-dependent methyltransferase